MASRYTSQPLASMRYTVYFLRLQSPAASKSSSLSIDYRSKCRQCDARNTGVRVMTLCTTYTVHSTRPPGWMAQSICTDHCATLLFALWSRLQAAHLLRLAAALSDDPRQKQIPSAQATRFSHPQERRQGCHHICLQAQVLPGLQRSTTSR
jgi:hypothetical protein